jgi:hypothetical protein
MNIITVSFILFIIGLLFFGSLPFISNYDRRKKEKLFRQLSREGATNGLTFCSQEILQDKVIGVDGIHRKILILERKKNLYNTSIISLDEVHHCQLVTNEEISDPAKKTFGQQISAGALELRFEFNNHHQASSIIFTNGLNNSKRDLVLLKAKAEYWAVMFSKMLNQQVSVNKAVA